MMRICCTLSALVLSTAAIAAVAPVPAESGWIERAPLPSARYGHGALLLPDGTVLVAGGYDGHDPLYMSDVYDFRKNVWLRHAGMQFQHITGTDFALVALPRGRALAISANNAGASQSEEYDPLKAVWHPIPALPDERFDFKTIALPNGDVLVVGGYLPNLQLTLTSLASCLLYHPATATWTTTGAMSISRLGSTLNVLGNGRVLAAGGVSVTDNAIVNFTSCEAYIPELGTWQSAGALTRSRPWAEACALANGDAVIVSGVDYDHPPTSERYLAATQTTVTTNRCTVPYTDAFAVVRGGALRAGGTEMPAGGTSYSAVDIFSTKTRTWSQGPALHTARRKAPAVSLPSGEVLVIGGAGTFSEDNQHPLASTELYSLRPYFTQANAQASGTVGRTFSYQLDAATIATYTSVGLPPGIALNKVTGHLGGKPTTAGSYNVRIGATNEFGKSLMYLSLTIAPAQPPGSAAPEAPQGGG